MLEEAPVKEKIHIEVMSKRKSFGFCFKVRTRGSRLLIPWLEVIVLQRKSVPLILEISFRNLWGMSILISSTLFTMVTSIRSTISFDRSME